MKLGKFYTEKFLTSSKYQDTKNILTGHNFLKKILIFKAPILVHYFGISSVPIIIFRQPFGCIGKNDLVGF